LELEPWERLLESPSSTPNFLPQPEPLPKPYAADAKPINELPIPRLKIAYPPGPLIQPEGKLALCNYNGVVTAWIDRSEDPSKSKPSIEPIKNHKTGQIICWFDYHSRPPGMTDEDAVRGQPHFVPVFDAHGRIINWVPEPDGKHRRPPTLTATALVSDQLRAHFAWLDPATTHAALMPHASVPTLTPFMEGVHDAQLNTLSLSSTSGGEGRGEEVSSSLKTNKPKQPLPKEKPNI